MTDRRARSASPPLSMAPHGLHGCWPSCLLAAALAVTASAQQSKHYQCGTHCKRFHAPATSPICSPTCDLCGAGGASPTCDPHGTYTTSDCDKKCTCCAMNDGTPHGMHCPDCHGDGSCSINGTCTKTPSGPPPSPPPPPPSPPSPPPPPPPKPPPPPPPPPAPGIACNPSANPPEECPGGKACPRCGKPVCDCPATPSPAPPGPPAPPAPGAGPSPPPGNYTTYPLVGAKCINGAPATVQAWINPTPSTTWVIQIGGPSPSVGFCISASACAQFGAKTGKPPPPTPTPAPVPINGGTGGNSITGQNCTTNPDFCHANQVQISTCDMSFGLGNAEVTGADFGLKAPEDTTTMSFQGPQILAASIKKLGELGLSKANKVLLTGFAAGGQQVFLTADAVHAAVKAVAPALAVFKALPVDGLRANINQPLSCTCDIMKGNCCPKGGFLTDQCYNTSRLPSWYESALSNIQNVSKIPTAQKMWSIDALPSIKVPLFAVNQMMPTWDAQCQFEGQPSGNILQVACSERGNYFKEQYTCVQYPDLCLNSIIGAWWKPAQEQYVSLYDQARGQNGGFFHQCFLGSYWEESFGTTPQAAGKVERPTTGVWNTITVGGKTMQEAVSEFWNEPVEREGGGGTTRLVVPAKLYQDPPWDPNGKPPSDSGGTPELAAQMHAGAPVVPWYTAKWMSNPTCRGYPWY